MENKKFSEILATEGLVVVVRGSSRAEAKKTVAACIAGGVKLIEITFTVPEADLLIAEVKKQFADTDAVIGAGTVLTVEQAQKALNAGAEFIVSPCFDETLTKFVLEKGVAYAPGILSATELCRAVNAGAQIVKLFPGGVVGPEGLKALLGPFPNAKIMPTGGVSYDNLDAWFKAGAVAVGAGSNLTRGAKNGDFKAVENDAASWIERIKELRG